MGERILSSILEHYRFPDQTFVGSPESLEALKQALDRRVSGILGTSSTGPGPLRGGG
jgi:hypothetical protein